MRDTFVAFDARQRYDCVKLHIETEFVLSEEKKIGTINDYYPLH